MNRIVVREFSTVAELAGLMDASVSEVVRCGFGRLGILLTIDQHLDFEQITDLAAEFGFVAIRREPRDPGGS